MSDLTNVNTLIDREALDILDRMAREDGLNNRSAFVRWLIRQEAKRRNLPRPAEAQTQTEANK